MSVIHQFARSCRDSLRPGLSDSSSDRSCLRRRLLRIGSVLALSCVGLPAAQGREVPADWADGPARPKWLDGSSSFRFQRLDDRQTAALFRRVIP